LVFVAEAAEEGATFLATREVLVLSGIFVAVVEVLRADVVPVVDAAEGPEAGFGLVVEVAILVVPVAGGLAPAEVFAVPAGAVRVVVVVVVRAVVLVAGDFDRELADVVSPDTELFRDEDRPPLGVGDFDLPVAVPVRRLVEEGVEAVRLVVVAVPVLPRWLLWE